MSRRESSRDRADRLWGEHASDLLAFLVYRTGDPGLAEDVLADTFERVLRTRRGWRDDGASERTWLYAIALNRLRDVLRRRGAEERAYARTELEEPVGSLDHLADREAVRRALATLPDDERTVVALRFGGGLGLQEVADLLEVPRSTVEGRLYRALRRLRDVL
jgi:RNA polymerase sigma-70 factor, ECF subfamily